MSWDWDNIRFFLAVARAGSIVGAADTLAVSHSTVSRRMHGFERSLGVRLFDRRAGTLVLTPAGERTMHSAERAEREFLALERAIAGGDSRLSGSLRVTVPYLFGSHFLMPHLAAFAAQHTEIELQVCASLALLNLTRREADVAIRVTNQPPETAVGRRVATLPWALYARTDLLDHCGKHPQALPYIGLDDGSPLPSWYAQHMPGARMGARMNDPVLILAAVRQGMGAGVLARCIGDDDPTLQRIVDVPEYDTGLWLLTHADIRSSMRVRAFLDFMYAAVNKQLGSLSD